MARLQRHARLDLSCSANPLGDTKMRFMLHSCHSADFSRRAQQFDEVKLVARVVAAQNSVCWARLLLITACAQTLSTTVVSCFQVFTDGLLIRMDKLQYMEVDQRSKTVRAEAGATIGQLVQMLADHDLVLPCEWPRLFEL